MHPRLRIGQFVGRFALSGFSFLFGVFLLASGLTLLGRPPAFLPLAQVKPSTWTAFDGGLIILAIGLMMLALAACWRTVILWRKRGNLPPRASVSPLLGNAFGSPFPRYVIDVAICLGVSAAVLTAPVLLVGGPPMLFLSFFATSLGVISLIAGGLLGVIRG